MGLPQVRLQTAARENKRQRRVRVQILRLRKLKQRADVICLRQSLAKFRLPQIVDERLNCREQDRLRITEQVFVITQPIRYMTLTVCETKPRCV